MGAQINTNQGRRGRGRRSFKPSSEINVTPLVDVMLVLLVIFMVTAPMLTVGVPVDLPKTQAAKMNDNVDPLIISVNAEGRIFLQETELTEGDLIPRLMAITNSNPDAKVYVRGDEKLAYGKVMETMGLIAAAGFSKVSLIAEMPAGPGTKSLPKLSSPQPKMMAPLPQRPLPPVTRAPQMPQTTAPSYQAQLQQQRRMTPPPTRVAPVVPSLPTQAPAQTLPGAR